MAEGSQTEVPVNQSEAGPKKTPTEASEGFLTGWRNKVAFGLPIAIPLATGLAIRFSGPLPTEDFGRGDYKTAAIKGVIAAASATPLIIKTMRLR